MRDLVAVPSRNSAMPRLLFRGSMLVLLCLSLTLQPSTAAPPEVEALLKLLADKDEGIRLKAAKDLGKLKEKAKDAIPALKAATADPDEDVREVAAKALAAITAAVGKGAVPKADDALAPVVKELRSKDAKVKIAALSKLEAMGEAAKPAGGLIVELGMLNPNPAIRAAANSAFEKIDPAVFKEVVTISYEEKIEKRDQAVAALQSLGEEGKAALPVLKGYHRFLLTQRRYTPTHTLEALVSIAPEDDGVHKIILDLLGGSEDALPVLPLTGKAKRLTVERSRRAFVVALYRSLRVADKLVVPALLSGVIQSERAEDQALLVIELGKLELDAKPKYTALMSALTRSTKARATVINELAKLGPDAKAAIPVLTALKTDKEEAVRVAATAAIEAIK